MASDAFAGARAVIASGLEARAFPAAAIDMGGVAGSDWRDAFGRLTFDLSAPATTLDTIFDLASLTKVIATASIAMRLIGSQRLSLDRPVKDFLTGFQSPDRSGITIRH